MTRSLEEFDNDYKRSLKDIEHDFIRNLDHVESVANSLVDYGVFTNEEKKSVMKYTRPNQKKALFDLLLEKSFTKIDCIMAAVDFKLNSSVVVLLKQIKMSLIRQRPRDLIIESPALALNSIRGSESSTNDLLVDGRDRFPKSGTKLYTCPKSDEFEAGEIMNQAAIDNEYEDYYEEIAKQNSLESYILEGERYAFVMSNVTFPGSPAKQRTFWGPEDAYQICGLLSACDFKITYLKNCIEKDLTEPSGRFSEWREWVKQQKPAAIVVVLMTHGDEKEQMEMSDGKWVSYRKHVFEKFSNKENKDLQGVPKLIFLQCCRYNYRTDQSHREDKRVFDDKTESIFSDMLIVYATLPGFISERGWLITGLCQAIRKFGQDDDIITILIKLNAALRKLREEKHVPKSRVLQGAKPGEYTWADHKHVCPFENIAFTKKFYFNYVEDKEKTWRKDLSHKGVMRA